MANRKNETKHLETIDADKLLIATGGDWQADLMKMDARDHVLPWQLKPLAR